MDRHDDAQKGVDCFELLAYQTQRDVIESSTAVLFGNAHTEQVQGSHVLQH